MSKEKLGPRQVNKRGNENFDASKSVERWRAHGGDQVEGARQSVSDKDVGQQQLMDKQLPPEES